jgi:hypothetical protein
MCSGRLRTVTPAGQSTERYSPQQLTNTHDQIVVRLTDVPTQWTLNLAHSVDLRSATDQAASPHDVLHAVGCSFFSEADADHDADTKPFATHPVGPLHAIAGLTMTWLPDRLPPAAIPTHTRLRGTTITITAMRHRSTPVARLGAELTGRRVRLAVTTPAHFRHHGRDYPLPDPYIMYTSLGRRLCAANPNTAAPEQLRELAQSVVVYTHDIHTEPFTWHGTRSAGFIGTVTVGIPIQTPPPIRRLFNTLNGFAAFAGIGHGTTHGLGAVTVTCTTRDTAPPPPPIIEKAAIC